MTSRTWMCVISAIAAGLAMTSVPAARADTTRGCKGDLRILDRPPNPGQKSWDLIATFEGRGSCKNRFHADDCRKRAADAIIRCAREMWATRNDEVLPPSCFQTAGQSAFVRTKMEGIVPGFPAHSALARARFAACCKFNPSAAEVPAHLWVVVTGDTGCISKTSSQEFDRQGGSWHAVQENAPFNCARARELGVCGR
jgi:hypothetical protein